MMVRASDFPGLAELLRDAGITGEIIRFGAEQRAFLRQLLAEAETLWPHEDAIRRRTIAYFNAITHPRFQPQAAAAAQQTREDRAETGLESISTGGGDGLIPPDSAKEQETAELLRDLRSFLTSSPGAQLAGRAVEILHHLRILAWVIACLVALGILAGQLRGQVIVRLKNGGVTQMTRAGGLVILNCSSNMSCTWTAATNTWDIASAATAGTAWSSLTAPTLNLSMAMAANTSTFTHSAATGLGANLWTWTDTLNNTGTGILGRFTTASGSALTPWQADSNSNGVKLDTTGVVRAVGTGGIDAAAVTLGTLPIGRIPAAIDTRTTSLTVFDPVTTDSGRVQFSVPTASTITRVACSVKTAATSVSINIDKRAEATPDTAGTAALSADLVCVPAQATSCASGCGVNTITSAALTARAPNAITISAVSGTPDTLRIFIEYTVN